MLPFLTSCVNRRLGTGIRRLLMMRLTIPLLLVLACTAASAQSLDAIEDFFQWVRDLGGEINLEIKLNSNGVRGAFATKDLKEFDNIAAIPAASIMNVGSYNDSFAVPTLTVLRELKDPHSRFKPYIAVWPAPDQVINSCNMDLKYVPMWKSPYWEKSILDWDTHLKALLHGNLDADLEYTIKEMVGNAPVTLDDIKYACAISSTRYVSSHRRRRLLMAPVFDLANHKRDCAHFLSNYDSGDFLYFQAGAEIKKGDEICYSYGSLRDDYALSHYGFLPELEDPPRLALVDIPDFNPEDAYNHDDPPGEETFEGTPEAMIAEMRRLTAIHKELQASGDPLPPPEDGNDYLYNALKELQRRRMAAIEYEVKRIASVLDVVSEL